MAGALLRLPLASVMHSVTRMSRRSASCTYASMRGAYARASPCSRPIATSSVISDWYVTLAARSISVITGIRSRSSSGLRGAVITGFTAPGSAE